jgi:hypothetical protein
VPALVGEIISTLRDGSGAPIVAVVIFYDPATGLLRNATYSTVADGDRFGAVVVDNITNGPVAIQLTNDVSGNARKLNVPAHGRAFTVAQLAALPANITSLSDLNGFSFNFA